MKVLLIGAGFIGSRVALAIRRAGHHVTAVVRDLEKRKSLLKEEIQLVEGDFSSLLDIHKNANSPLSDSILNAEAIVWTAADNTAAVKAVLDHATSSSKRTAHSLDVKFVLLSGCLMYIPSDFPVDEAAEVNVALPRYQTEKCVLNTPGICGTVARPSFLYGLSGSYMGMWWKELKEKGTISVKGNSSRIYNYIHADDLADGFVKIIESPKGTVDKEIFNFSADFQCSVLSLVKVLATAAGYHGEIASAPNANAYDEYFDRSSVIDSSKAKRLLGWSAKRPSLVAEPTLYYNAWKQYQ